MPEELQNLLERIQKDGVEKADAEAARIVAEARSNAQSMLADAESSARSLNEKSQADAAAFMERGKKSMEQAARDVILSVGEAIKSSLRGIAAREVTAMLDVETIKQMLVKVVDAYARTAMARVASEGGHSTGGMGLDILLKPEDRDAIAGYLMSKYAAELRKGLEIKADKGVISGFRVSVRADKVEHDLTGPAIVDAICELLRPAIAEIVRNAMQKPS